MDIFYHSIKFILCPPLFVILNLIQDLRLLLQTNNYFGSTKCSTSYFLSKK